MSAADQDPVDGELPQNGPRQQGDAAGEVPAAEAEPRAEAKLLELLICPVSRTRLEYDAAHHELISRAAGLAYPIRNGVPMMVVAAARTLEDSEVFRAKPR